MFFARIVMPRSRSRSFESRMQSPTSCEARNSPLWRRRQSTSVVFPWSTWAMIAMFRTSERRILVEPVVGLAEIVDIKNGRVRGRVRERNWQRLVILARLASDGYGGIWAGSGAIGAFRAASDRKRCWTHLSGFLSV